MAKYIVLRPFPAKEKMSRGQIIENPNWRNLPSLLSTGYLRVVEETAEEKLNEAADKLESLEKLSGLTSGIRVIRNKGGKNAKK